MILSCNFEELGALKQGASALLGGGPGEGAPVAAPPEGRAVVEALLPRLSGDINIDTLAEQREVMKAVSAIVDGSGTANHVAIWSDSDTLTSDVDFQFISDTLYVNETANTGMTIGVTLNQGANDDEILALKSSDVAHGATSYAETDTYAAFMKSAGAAGGLLIRGLRDSGGAARQALSLQGFLAENASTTKSTSGRAIVDIDGFETSGASVTDTVANGNVVAFRTYRDSAETTIAIIDEDGDLYIDGGLVDLSDTNTYLRFDSDDSMALVCGGVTMLDLVEVAQVVEEEFGIEIKGDEAEKLKTVGDAVDLVVSRAG